MNGVQTNTTESQVGTINAAGGWHFADVGDFNGDGKTDLLLLNDTTHGVAVWEMDGTHVIDNPQVGTINAAGGWHFEGVGDFNGDGKSDLLLLNDTTHGVAVWKWTARTSSPIRRSVPSMRQPAGTTKVWETSTATTSPICCCSTTPIMALQSGKWTAHTSSTIRK